MYIQSSENKSKFYNKIRDNIQIITPVPKRRNFSKLAKANIVPGFQSTAPANVSSTKEKESKRPPIPLGSKLFKFPPPES